MLQVLVKPGDTVEEGDTLVVLEAMKVCHLRLQLCYVAL